LQIRSTSATESTFTAAKNILRTAIPVKQEGGFLRSGWIKEGLSSLMGVEGTVVQVELPATEPEPAPVTTSGDEVQELPEGTSNFYRDSLFPLPVDDEAIRQPEKVPTGAPVQLIVIDLSEEKLEAFSIEGESLMTAKIKASRFGIGSEQGSKKTPIGEWTLNKEPKHSYGPTYRLSGEQGKERGILIHPGNLGHGSRGCIHVSWDKIKALYSITASKGTELRIQE